MRVVRSHFIVVCSGLLLAVALHNEVTAQVGNEWINYSQPYFKIPTAREGIYRLGYADLQAAAFPVAGDPAKIQLFHRGVEQAIYVNGQSDGQFDPSDYLEFYGIRNDGTLDAQLYKPAASQPHSYHNLFSDTTSYFLTLGSVSGKRMTSFFDDNTGGLPGEPSHTDEKRMVLTSQYAIGIDYGDVQVTAFELGEGWTGNQILQNQFLDYSLPDIGDGVPAGGLPVLEVLLVGRGPMQHAGEIYVGDAQRLVAGFNFTGYGTHTLAQAIDWSDIRADGTLAVRVRVVGVGGQPDRLSASIISLRYPQRLNVGGNTEKTFLLAENPGDKSYIQLENAPAGLRLFDVTDPASVSRIMTVATTTLNAVVPATNTVRRIYATSQPLTPSVRSVFFRQIVPNQHDYVIITNPLLRKPAMGYPDPVAAYGGYRASEAGGGYDTLVVNVQQLFDQFNYGEPSPLAIFHFMKFLTNVQAPKYLLLVGKGLDVYYQYYRNPSGALPYRDFVPSAGFPGSDMAYTAGLAGTTVEPAVPTGRIPATKPEDVGAYLNKLKEMEQLPYDDLWRKNVLHLSGGINEGEPQLFKSYMTGFQSIAEDYRFGGKVSAVAKYSKEIQHINVAEQVNSGLNLITFFGHSSPSALDFEVGYVTDPVQGYNNKGKYPVMLMNGCDAGSFFLNYTLLGEDWLLAPDRGATGFIAHSAFGLVNQLRRYTQTFYEVGYRDPAFINQGIGDIQKETARRFMINSAASPVNITQAQQMVLIGDPALRMFGAPKADLEINDNNVSIESFDGQPISAVSDSFAVKLIIRNFGQAINTTVRVEIQRTLDNQSTLVYDTLYPAVKYSDTLMFIIRKGRETGFGNNVFRITVDPDDVLPELTKANNVATKSLLIALNGTKNLFPVNDAIVSSPQVSLAFQTTDVFSGEREFVVELDTLNTFDSPFMQRVVVTGNVLARHTVSMVDADTLTYYWRTKLSNPLPGEREEWTMSAFTFIKDGPTGWAQVHFPQYLVNQTQGLVRDTELRRLQFLSSVTPVEVKTFGSNHPAPFTDVSVKIANAEYNLYGPAYDCRDNSINLIAFDRKSTVPYTAVKFEWYNRAGRNCGRKPLVINNFIPSEMVTGNNDDIIQYVDNVEAGDSVLIYNIGDAGYSAWPAAAKVKLGELGISVAQLDALEDGEPVIIFGRKGTAPGTAKVIVASGTPKDVQELSVTGSITGGYSQGVMTSSWIGPADQWNAFIPKPGAVEAGEQMKFDITGITLQGVEQPLFEEVTGVQDLSAVDAAEYPYLKVAFHTEDDTNLTPTQLNQWLVTFSPVPEGLLVSYGDRGPFVIAAGEHWTGNYGFINVSDKAFKDSLSVRYEVFNQVTRTDQIEFLKIKAPLPGDTTAFALHFDTHQQDGLNDINVFVNPRVLPEQYYDNNVLQLAGHVEVKADYYNPVLEVSVDGRMISDGDYVSPNPFMLIKLWDENEFIKKLDTAGVRIFLTYPCGQPECTPTPVPLSGADIVWKAATDTSVFQIAFTPKNLADGVYRLRVEGADASGNRSGVDPYEISFMVKQETFVTISDPYPNPFSQEVQVDIVITGGVVPDEFDVQVINVNGQLQSHWVVGDFPAFHIGRNVWYWNGTGKDGSPLPGGVYIYKLNLGVNGTRITKIGKLVLVK